MACDTGAKPIEKKEESTLNQDIIENKKEENMSSSLVLRSTRV